MSGTAVSVSGLPYPRYVNRSPEMISAILSSLRTLFKLSTAASVSVWFVRKMSATSSVVMKSTGTPTRGWMSEGSMVL